MGTAEVFILNKPKQYTKWSILKMPIRNQPIYAFRASSTANEHTTQAITSALLDHSTRNC